MDAQVAFAPVIQWAIGLGAAWAAVIAGAVWALLRQATDRFACELARHSKEQSELLARASNEQIDTRRRVGVLHERIEKLDLRTSASPSVDSVHQLAIQVHSLGGDIKQVTASIEGLEKVLTRVEKQLDRHEDALLQERRT